MLLCNDLDLLRREPGVLRECRVAASRLTVLSTTFVGTDGTVTAGTLTGDTPIRPGMLAWVEQRARAFVVIGLGDGLIQLAAVHPNMPDEPTNEFTELESGPGDGAVTTEVWTFPQIASVSRQIRRELGLENLELAGQFDREQLRELAALRTLAAIFRSMSALDRTLVNDGLGRGVSFSDAWWRHAERYEQASARELRRLEVLIDADLDQKPEGSRRPGSPGLQRG
jgi:hypothetical protein